MRVVKILLLLWFMTSSYGYIANPPQSELPLEVQRTHTKSKIPNSDENTNYINTQQYSSPPVTRKHCTFYSGSLKANITQVAHEFGWREVVWLPQYDFQWIGQTELPATNIHDVLSKVLRDFPLQAVFYEGNHVLVISARNVA